MVNWINALLDLFKDACIFFLQAPLYGSITVGYVLVAIAVMGTLVDFLVRRFK